jgi:hypothetical protein
LSQARPGFNDAFPTIDDMMKLVETPIAYHYEHVDGLRTTMIMMNGLVQDFNFAAQLADDQQLSTQMYLPMPPKYTSLANFFTPQVANVEQMFLSGEATYPVERTLMTTGLTAAAVDSLFEEEKRIETPHLEEVTYAAPTQSTYWRT